MSKATHEDRSTTPKAIEDCHSLLAWMLPQLDKFPRARRFTLGSRIEDGLLFVLEKLVEAAYSKAKAAPLRAANLRLEVVRHLWRLAYEANAVAHRSWAHGAKLMVELGRQIGGWGKAVGQHSRAGRCPAGRNRLRGSCRFGEAARGAGAVALHGDHTRPSVGQISLGWVHSGARGISARESSSEAAIIS